MSCAGDRLRAPALVVAVLALALGLAACGDSDGDGGSGDSQAEAKQASADSTSAATPTSDEDKVIAVMRDLRDYFNTYDGKAFCAALTKAGQTEVVTETRDWPIKKRTCVNIVSEYARGTVKVDGIRQTPVDVRRVTVKGGEATILMKGGIAGRRAPEMFRLAKEDGQWKVVDPLTGPAKNPRS